MWRQALGAASAGAGASARTGGRAGRPSRPLSWQGPRPVPKKSQQATSQATRQRLRLLRLLHVLPPARQPAQFSLAHSLSELVYRLRSIDLRQLQIHHHLRTHSQQVKVELDTLPEIVLGAMEKLVTDMRNQMRILVCVFVVLFLLR